MLLNADLIEGFAGAFLSPRYDQPRPTPPLHRKVWEVYASDDPQVVCAAPRDHAKSTAFTVDYVLAEVLFRRSDYVIIIGATEELSQELVSNISEELHVNDDLIREFGVAGFEVDQKTELIVRMEDGHRFRVLARGAEQKIRGRMWKGKRPNLIVGDDLEDDEQVESKERRSKFRRWFFRAAKQALAKGGRIRVHGTVLHEDSLLARLLRNKTWTPLFFKAHRSYDDFRDLLWPERWSEEELRKKRREFEEDNDAPGYSQEFLNDPRDTSEAFIRREDLLPMKEEDYESDKVVCAAADFAASKAESADNTSFVVGGKDVSNLLHLIDDRTGHWNSQEVVEEIFSIQDAWKPVVFWVEDGVIWKILAPMVYREMQRRDTWVNIQPMPSTKDKAVRGRSFQKLTRAHGMRFDKRASWWPVYEAEILRFTAGARAILDDRFDATGLLCRGFDDFSEIGKEDFMSEEEHDFEYQSRAALPTGRNAVTGY